MARHHRATHERLTWPPTGDGFPVIDLSQKAPAAPPVQARPADRPPRHASPPAVLPPSRTRGTVGAWSELPARVRLAATVVGLGVLAVLAVVAARQGVNRAPEPAPSALVEAPPAPRTASLAVRTEPAGAEVFLDGRRLGVSPVTVPAIDAGEHLVVIRHEGRTIRHAARVAAGESVSVVVPIPPAPAAAASPARAAGDGSLRVVAPVELRVSREGRLLGTSEMARIPIAPGTHTVALSNEAAGYRITKTVTVSPGRTTTVEVDVPEEPVAINAIPWAEVFVDGRPVGETPLGTLRLALGPHVVVLRHPRFGEKTVNTLIKAGEPARISVDMRSQ